ncbi:biotin--[acetyl-CoA-carboxylase] ligase [Leptolyngbya sp. 7M]|uniref:biotin--[acetyl-CoA-carboxylase] ligase n=1 Tax=Leptolyngbya sp. 7M TaxID=2812896 RepID=UPI001B8CBB1A|nr:biotin--[acetyl-CoA-carboxylase] ligase [Leptolyngbya sp. 7M]QYO65210.1 biotin--[acetyl-CoA-carboxylase] ligase [Leptolyngbya sp. 7M]
MNIQLVFFDTIDSTNTEALRQARSGVGEGLCIVARQQTAGRGRHGRVWISENGAGLYFSIVLRPRIAPRLLPLITLMSGVAVYDTLKDFRLSPDIKWVNDILINERKISGILAETTETDKGLAVIVGIGINIRKSNFPPEIAAIATSIEDETSQSGNNASSVPTPEQLAQVLSNYLVHYYELLEGGNSAKLISEWCRRSTYASGKNVRIISGNEVIEGITDGLEDIGALRLKKADGKIAIIHAGDVEQLRSNEYGKIGRAS